MPATSEPAPGSVMPTAVISLAGDHLAQVGLFLRLIAGVVQVRAGHVGVHQHGDDEAGEGGLAQRFGEHQVGQRVGVATAIAASYISPNRPACPMRRSTSRGTKPCSSQAAACGSTSRARKRAHLLAQQFVLGGGVDGLGDHGAALHPEHAELRLADRRVERGADRPSASTRRVSAGSITPSSQRRALAK
jgi:hypothetical protein